MKTEISRLTKSAPPATPVPPAQESISSSSVKRKPTKSAPPATPVPPAQESISSSSVKRKPSSVKRKRI